MNRTDESIELIRRVLGSTEACLEQPVRDKEKDILSMIGKYVFDGGDDQDRTDYLLNAIQALSQMSYAPKGIGIYWHNAEC